MTIRPIVIYPDPRLRKPADRVTEFNDQLVALLEDLTDTMYDADGLGIAAPQIGVSRRVMVINCDNDPENRQPLYCINPEILSRSDQHETLSEGCLSIPDIREEIKRPLSIVARYFDRHGTPRESSFENLEARCFVHETDHLNGKLFIDYLSFLKRRSITNQMRKRKRATPAR